MIEYHQMKKPKKESLTYSSNNKIKNIKTAKWIKTIIHYPRTVYEMKLLVSVLDKFSIMDKYNVCMASNMDSDKLDILYAILRITNKVFNCYLTYAVQKIFLYGLKDLFTCTDLTSYDLFFDQLTQDFYHFVPIMIKLSPSTNVEIIKKIFCDYLKTSFSKPFYEELIAKLGYSIQEKFYTDNDQFFLNVTKNFLDYTNKYLSETIETMDIFLGEIFSPECASETVEDIITCLNQNIDLDNLFKEDCVEIDIYSELKLNSVTDDDLEISDNDISVKQQNINIILQNIGYHIYGQDTSIFQPFVDHNLFFSKSELLELVLQVLIKHKKEPYIINTNNEMTLKEFYHLEGAMFYDDFCLYIATNKTIPDAHSVDFIMRLLSRLLDVEILFFGMDLTITKIDNTIHNKYPEPINIYQSGGNIFHTLYSGKIFKPLNPLKQIPKPKNFLLKTFKKSNKLQFNETSNKKNSELCFESA